MLVEIHVRDAARDPTLANAECGIEFLFIPNSEFRSRRTGLARYGRSQTSACRLLDRAPSRWHLARPGIETKKAINACRALLGGDREGDDLGGSPLRSRLALNSCSVPGTSPSNRSLCWPR